jgi:hypothetical protein
MKGVKYSDLRTRSREFESPLQLFELRLASDGIEQRVPAGR